MEEIAWKCECGFCVTGEQAQDVNPLAAQVRPGIEPPLSNSGMRSPARPDGWSIPLLKMGLHSPKHLFFFGLQGGQYQTLPSHAQFAPHHLHSRGHGRAAIPSIPNHGPVLQKSQCWWRKQWDWKNNTVGCLLCWLCFRGAAHLQPGGLDEGKTDIWACLQTATTLSC